MTIDAFLALSDEEREGALLAAISVWDARGFVARATRDKDDIRGPGYDFPDDNGLMWEDYQAETRGRKL